MYRSGAYVCMCLLSLPVGPTPPPPPAAVVVVVVQDQVNFLLTVGLKGTREKKSKLMKFSEVSHPVNKFLHF